MKQHSDIDRVLEVWMSDGPTAIPDRVVDVVAARIGVQRQRRTWPFQGRTIVSSQIKLIAGLAAALVIAVVGYSLLPSTTGPGGPGGPTATATASAQPTMAPSAAPSTAPSAGAEWPAWYPPQAVVDANGAGNLSGGSYATQVFDPAFTYRGAAGWVNAYDEPDYFTLFPDTPANADEFERSGELAHVIFMGPHSSPYFTCESVERNGGTTAAEMVAAMETNEVLAVSGVVDVTIGGLTGKQFDVRRSPDWTGTCPEDSGLPQGIDATDERTRGMLLDVPGTGVLVIFMYSTASVEHDTFIAEAMPIVESFEFDIGQ